MGQMELRRKPIDAKALPAPKPAAGEFSREQVELIKRTVAKGATDDELQLFLAQCRRTGLDPYTRQIYAVKRWDAREKREVMQTQVSIDGFRLIAERSGKYAGQTEPQWCGLDRQWVNAWLDEEPPAAARIGVLRSDFKEPCYAVARYGAYVQMKQGGEPNSMWARMPDVLLSKCSEALALRKAFPQELSGLYTNDELPADDRDQEVNAHVVGPPRPWTTFKGMIDEFAKLRGRLGTDDRIYYEVLAKFGKKHSNEFRDVREAATAYQALLARVLEHEAKKPATEPLAAEPPAEGEGDLQ
jgi:phage recombination protein Bet